MEKVKIKKSWQDASLDIACIINTQLREWECKKQTRFDLIFNFWKQLNIYYLKIINILAQIKGS